MIEVRRISTPNGQVNLFNLLSNSFFGKAYKRYIKPVSLVHSFVLWISIRLLPIALLIYARYELNFRNRPLKKLSEYASNRQLLIESQLVELESPEIFPKNRNIVANLSLKFEFPDIYVATISNAIVTGASNFINVDGYIVSHDLFRSSHDYTSEELHCRFFLDSKKSCVTLLSKIEVTTDIESGVIFTDAVSSNYVHFLTEILPKIYLYSKACPNPNASLVIDSGLHANMMQALEMVIAKNVNIIGLEVDAHILVKSLKVVSACGYIPFQRRANTKHLTDHSDGVFSPLALGMMSDFIKKSVAKLVIKSKLKKIFIKRNSKIRNLANAEDVESILIADGFTIIEPENLSFIEQVDIFSNAEIVIGATGAAFGNLIFCNPATKIIILTSDYKNMIYGYWQSMANAVGNKVTYVIGKSIDINAHLHSNFKINISDIKDAIAS